MRKFFALMLCLTMAASLLAGCGTYTKDGSSSPAVTAETSAATASESPSAAIPSTADQKFTFVGNDVDTLNSIAAASNNALDVLYLLQAGLFRTYQGEVQNDLCQSYTVSDDGLTYTFTLRDAQWSDGVAIKAQDFLYAFKAALDPANASMTGYYYMGVKNGGAFYGGQLTSFDDVGVKATDDKTLVITLEQPSNSFINLLAFYTVYPIREDFHTKAAETYGTTPDTLLYSGPYVLKDWQLSTSLTYVKNDKYWDSANAFPVKEIQHIVTKDHNTDAAMFQNGEVDAVREIGVNDLAALKDYLHTYYTGGVDVFRFNTNGLSEESGKILSNQNFRSALYYAIDREGIVNALMPTSKATSRLISDVYTDDKGTAYTNDYAVTVPALGGDADKAKAYLDAALKELGYSSVKDLPEINLLAIQSDSIKTICEAVVDGWKQILGVESIVFTQQPLQSAIGAFYSGQFEIFYLGTGSGYTADAILSGFVTGGSDNMGFFSDPAFDALYQQTVASTGADYYANLQKAEQEFINFATIIPIDAQGVTSAVQSYVTGYGVSQYGFGYEFNQLHVSK